MAESSQAAEEFPIRFIFFFVDIFAFISEFRGNIYFGFERLEAVEWKKTINIYVMTMFYRYHKRVYKNEILWKSITADFDRFTKQH